MRVLLRYLILAFSVCAITPSWANAISLPEKQHIQRSVNQLIVGKRASQIGVLVQSLDTGEVIYERSPYRAMAPASTQKLLTAIAALTYLGPNFSFNTALLTDASSIRNGVMEGNLSVKFSGDPSLTATDVNNLFQQLAAQGVRRIQGSVFVDNGDYSKEPYGAGWVQKDFMYHYAAPVNAIIINENSFNLRLKPSQLHQRAVVSSNLPPHAASFQNNLITTTSRGSCPINIQGDQHNHYSVSGCIVQKWGIQSTLLAVKDPSSYAKSLISLALQENNIRLDGSIRLHYDKDARRLLVSHESAPLKILIIRMLKKSDNLFANTLLKKLGQLYFNTTGTWSNGAQALKDILTRATHVDFKNSVILDGAGLSPYNLVSPYQLSAALTYAYHNPKIASYLLPALPLAGVDGTLKYRMHSFSPRLPVRGKTGTLQSVSSLAGYITTARKHHLSFVIMVNGYKGKCYPYTRLQDQICQFLAQHV